MNFIQNIRTLSLLGACALALASRTDASGSYHNHSGTNSWTHYEYIDFTSTGGAGHDATYNTQAFTPGNTVKYFPMQLTNNSSEGICYELNTGAPTFFPGATGDTRIWTFNLATSANKSLDDDSGEGAWSKARAYLRGPSNTWLNVYWAGFSSAANSIHFGTWITRLNLTEAQCTTGQALPWVKNINGTMTYSANAN